MPISKAQQKAVHKYVKNKYDRMELTVKKGSKEIIENAAKKINESTNAYIKKAVSERIKADTGEDIELWDAISDFMVICFKFYFTCVLFGAWTGSDMD